MLKDILDNGETVYGISPPAKKKWTCLTLPGVNTGFGGSADSRSSKLADVQIALLQHHHYGILVAADRAPDDQSDLRDHHTSHAMPPEWVRASMLVRANSVVRGHSAVTLPVIQSMVKLLGNNLLPIVPLRGSISASGDLSPLSYIAGAITGNPDIYIRTPSGHAIPSHKALRSIDLEPIILGPKEGLGLMNGTAPSAALASLVIHDADHLAILVQILTAMSVEALVGNPDSFDPFIARVRPHRGQTEVATNITAFLHDSKMTRDHQYSKRPVTELYQDRYALRTASQWIGPQIEDLALAREQVVVELNSTTDNPLIDCQGARILHGGNFQAASITSAMEKTRLSLQMFGKLMFAQTSELINPSLNHGLPANLSPDEPSTSYLMKGIDIGMASYISELGFLANPVSSHVQSAEMHNQSVNSLALISARYTREAAQIVSMMAASYLYIVCQALDLRAMQMTFFEALAPTMDKLYDEVFGELQRSEEREIWKSKLWHKLVTSWSSLMVKDSHDRATAAVKACAGELTANLVAVEAVQDADVLLRSVVQWTKRAGDLINQTYQRTCDSFFEKQTTSSYLGGASKDMYNHVRMKLEVPFHRGLADDPTYKVGAPGRSRLTLGSWISKIYEDLRSGGLYDVSMQCCRNTMSPSNGNGH